MCGVHSIARQLLPARLARCQLSGPPLSLREPQWRTSKATWTQASRRQLQRQSRQRHTCKEACKPSHPAVARHGTRVLVITGASASGLGHSAASDRRYAGQSEALATQTCRTGRTPQKGASYATVTCNSTCSDLLAKGEGHRRHRWATYAPMDSIQ